MVNLDEYFCYYSHQMWCYYC